MGTRVERLWTTLPHKLDIVYRYGQGKGKIEVLIFQGCRSNAGLNGQSGHRVANSPGGQGLAERRDRFRQGLLAATLDVPFGNMSLVARK